MEVYSPNNSQIVHASDPEASYHKQDDSVHDDTQKLPSTFSLPQGSTVKMVVFKLIPLIINYLSLFGNRSFALHYLKGYHDSVLDAAYGVSSTFISIFFTAVIVSLNIGLLPKLSQAFGAKDYHLLGICLHRGLMTNLFMLIPSTIFMIYSHKFFIMINYEENLAIHMRQYLIQTLPGDYMYSINQTLQMYLNSIGDFTTPSIIQIIGNVIFVFSNKILVGQLGYGLSGVSIAFNINNTFTALALLFWVVYKNPVPGSIFCFKKKSFEDLWELFKYQLSIGSVLFVEWSGSTILDMMFGSIGTRDAASYALVQGTIGLFYSLPIACCDVSMASIGNAIGENNLRKAKDVQKSCYMVTLVFSFVYDFFILHFENKIFNIMSDDAEDKALAKSMLIFWLVLSIPDALQMVIGSVLRSIGKEKIGLKLQFICMFVLAIPTAYTLAFLYDFGYTGLFIGFNIFASTSFISYVYVDCRVDWVKEARKIQEQLQKESQAAEEKEKLIDKLEYVEEKQ